MGGASWLYFLFSTMLNNLNFGRIWLTGGAVRTVWDCGAAKNIAKNGTKSVILIRKVFVSFEIRLLV